MRLSEQLAEAAVGFEPGPHGRMFKVKTPREMGFRPKKLPVGKLPTGKFHLTKGVVRRLREDFLTLAKSGKKVKNQDQAEEWANAVIRFASMLWGFREEILTFLKLLEWRADYDNATEEDKRIGREAAAWQNKLGPLSNLYLDPPVKKYAVYGRGKGISKEELFQGFQREFPKWDAQAKRGARKAWGCLNDLIGWIADKSPTRGAGGKPVVLSRPKEQNVRIEGFDVLAVGEVKPDTMARFREALKRYRQGAAKYMPILLKYKHPFAVEAEIDPRTQAIVNATYSKDRITMTAWGLSRPVDKVVRTIAHEMGHHINRKIGMKNWLRWVDFWEGGRKPIDLRKVLARQRSGESERDFLKRLQKEDPVLHMRLSAINPRHGLSVPMMQAEIDRGNPVYMASHRLPSAYASFASDEGFSEVIGHLVAYGPRTIPKETLAFMRQIIPGTRVEAATRPSEALMEALEITEKKKRKIRVSKLQYVHFTDEAGALGMVKEKKLWVSSMTDGVYAIPVGGAYVPSVQKTMIGRAKHREVAIVFTTDELPDKVYPEEAVWKKQSIRLKKARLMPANQAKRLLDRSIVIDDDTVRGYPTAS